ncbi:malate synthase G [Paremcibacter congregatus]|uniref:Malate synthase G n=1 Tax=Paremcibacter congregatus TaxID=2043170 RepID=A0A2G4YSJ6_9PROT|nr:malate synthase G [Paremcibacter congregatus]PHZ85273.1 malate synthase G [Paremcibacter congregatus]QDE27795.1 malate synthase G [Paremcibacter congregatus]
MTSYERRGALQIAQELCCLVEQDILPSLSVSADVVWQGLADLVERCGPINKTLLARREDLQLRLDSWHKDHRGAFDPDVYMRFLCDIGYLVPEGADFSIATTNLDAEVSILAGPQLVVPVDNARYALNAANARWGSLFDALYGSDVIAGKVASGGYDSDRGAQVIAWATDFLDQYIPLAEASHGDVLEYIVDETAEPAALTVALKGGTSDRLRYPEGFRARCQDGGRLTLLFCHHGLHLELVIDRSHPVGAENLSGVCDVILESALTAIMDCEDSVAAVDAEDKVRVYQNWLGLMKGDLTADVQKGGKTIERRLNRDRLYQGVCGEDLRLPGRSLMLVRNVGHLMTTDAVLDEKGNEIPEGILDALITSLCALHDRGANSRTGSIYIVKPKMHGPEEAAFTNDLFDQVEDILNLPRHTIKVGVMDEERHTTVNLKECIRAVKDRIFFINTGFLDRTGDEIHSVMEAGPMVRKNAMKGEAWIDAYERWNVDIGLSVGMQGRAQIGKGMWAMPDEMAQMMASKGDHLLAGASCAWVPSPTAATLHATHYHTHDVAALQKQLIRRPRAALQDLLTLPIMSETTVSDAEIAEELANNCQGILGYVVRWIDQGVGCSKVPDIDHRGLMEDRATLRISSQHIANWLHHDICTGPQVEKTLRRMALVVDQQNKTDPLYQPMGPDFTGVAFQAARDLIFKGRDQPNGYTEPLLHARRREAKAQQI